MILNALNYLFNVGIDIFVFYIMVAIFRAAINIMAVTIHALQCGEVEGYEYKKIIPGPGVNVLTLLIVLNATIKHITEYNIFTIWGS